MLYLIIVFIILIFMILLLLFVHFGFRVPKNPEKADPSKMGLEFETVSIPTVSNKHLFGWFLPAKDSTSTLVIFHGWGSNAEQMLPIASIFYNARINILLFDARNHGLSDRDGFSSLPKFAEDLKEVLMWLKKNYPKRCSKMALLGHSLGGAAVLLEASRRSDIDAVVSISAFAHPKWVMQRFLKSLHIPAFLNFFIIRYVEWRIGYKYEEIAPLNTTCCIKCPVLLVHGKIDETVPAEDAIAISSRCKKSTIKLMIVENAGHESIDKVNEHKEELLQFLIKSGFVV